MSTWNGNLDQKHQHHIILSNNEIKKLTPFSNTYKIKANPYTFVKFWAPNKSVVLSASVSVLLIMVL